MATKVISHMEHVFFRKKFIGELSEKGRERERSTLITGTALSTSDYWDFDLIWF